MTHTRRMGCQHTALLSFDNTDLSLNTRRIKRRSIISHGLLARLELGGIYINLPTEVRHGVL